MHRRSSIIRRRVYAVFLYSNSMYTFVARRRAVWPTGEGLFWSDVAGGSSERFDFIIIIKHNVSYTGMHLA